MQRRFVSSLAPSGAGAVLLTSFVVSCGGDSPNDPFGTGTAGGTATATASESASSGSNPESGPDSGMDSGPDSSSPSSSDGGNPDGETDAGPSGGTDGGVSDGVDSMDSGPKFDLEPNPGSATGVTGGDACSGGGGGGGGGDEMGGECTEKAPPSSFEAAIQWTWDGPGERESAVTPLVGNFTDDNGDGLIEPCGDIPDLVVAVTSSFFASTPGHLYVLDGATGIAHFQIPTAVDATITPAIGDIDGDGLLEIVTGISGGLGSYNLVAFANDGTVKWTSADPWDFNDALYASIALADLDNDGDVEIIATRDVFDHTGKLLWKAAAAYQGQFPTATTAADLDGDGDLEVVLGHAAYNHDGSQHYVATGIQPGFPQIANLDGDDDPEVLVTNGSGLSMLEHTGEVKYKNLRPTGVGFGAMNGWIRPATVHDFDGNGVSEFAMSSANNYTVYNGDATIVWNAMVADESGIAAGTAFDFLGDAKAEAMYADEVNFFIFDDQGVPYFSVPRSSRTIIEYPVVADLDNDRSAEIVVVSMSGESLAQNAPTVQVIRDKQDRWIQARRIWNQHTYHVTNVHENGTIPQFEEPNWKTLNTFRTQAQIESSGICKPPPPPE